MVSSGSGSCPVGERAALRPQLRRSDVVAPVTRRSSTCRSSNRTPPHAASTRAPGSPRSRPTTTASGTCLADSTDRAVAGTLDAPADKARSEVTLGRGSQRPVSDVLQRQPRRLTLVESHHPGRAGRRVVRFQCRSGSQEVRAGPPGGGGVRSGPDGRRCAAGGRGNAWSPGRGRATGSGTTVHRGGHRRHDGRPRHGCQTDDGRRCRAAPHAVPALVHLQDPELADRDRRGSRIRPGARVPGTRDPFEVDGEPFLPEACNVTITLREAFRN